MKILELTNYTSGGCGVGMRVLREAQLLSQNGHTVMVFSTNREKGTNKICPNEGKINNVYIKRFPRIKLGGDSYSFWNFSKEALKFKPDVIIAHSYRHLHTTKALDLGRKLKCKVFLVTHAPFERQDSRGIFASISVWLYDIFIGKSSLKKFDKIITISKWELPYLEKLGVPKSKIEYIPNGIDKEFFKHIRLLSKSPKSIGYWGRISRIKQLETLVKAINILKDIFILKITGPAEKDYFKELQDYVVKENLSEIEEIIPKSYNSHEQIRGLDQVDIFVLPSKSEGMPQTLIESMARGKIVVSSDNLAGRDLIHNGKNGFLFKNGSVESLVEVLRKIKSLTIKKLNSLQKEARRTSEKFEWTVLVKKLDRLIDTKGI